MQRRWVSGADSRYSSSFGASRRPPDPLLAEKDCIVRVDGKVIRARPHTQVGGARL